MELKVQLEEIKNSSASAADKTKQLDEYLNDHERIMNAVKLDIEKMQSALYRARQLLRAQEDISKKREVEITGYKISLVALRKHAKGMQEEIERQNEIIYEMDYKVNQMERKLSRMEGHLPDVDLYELNQKAKHLEKITAEQNEVHTIEIFLICYNGIHHQFQCNQYIGQSWASYRQK